MPKKCAVFMNFPYKVLIFNPKKVQDFRNLFRLQSNCCKAVKQI